jgi:hypothetical protein
MDISDVLLPIAPFTETSGSFVNAEGRVQGFHAVVKPWARRGLRGKCCGCWPTCWAAGFRLRVVAGRALAVAQAPASLVPPASWATPRGPSTWPLQALRRSWRRSTSSTASCAVRRPAADGRCAHAAMAPSPEEVRMIDA